MPCWWCNPGEGWEDDLLNWINEEAAKRSGGGGRRGRLRRGDAHGCYHVPPAAAGWKPLTCYCRPQRMLSGPRWNANTDDHRGSAARCVLLDSGFRQLGRNLLARHRFLASAPHPGEVQREIWGSSSLRRNPGAVCLPLNGSCCRAR